MEMNHNSEVNILMYWELLVRKKLFIAKVVIGCSLLLAVISLIVPEYYRAKAVLMPTEKNSGISSLIGQIPGGLASMAGIGAAGSSTERLLALLDTRTLAEEMIYKFNLIPALFNLDKDELDPNSEDYPNMEDAVIEFAEHVNIQDDKTNGTISVSIELQSPQLAADVANGYVESLQKFIHDNAFTIAKKNRVFIEERLVQSKVKLLEAGQELNKMYAHNRISSVDAQVDVPLDLGADFGSLGEMVTELESQEQQLAKKMVVKGVPQQVYLEYIALRKKLLIEINSLLTQQYEMAKIDEAKDELSFQVIDPARVPIKRSWPKRKEMVFMGIVVSLTLSSIFVCFVEHLRRLKDAYRREN